jgi:phage terminase small subunit
MAKLTPKQKQFCDEYLIDFNASAALLRAGYKSKNPDVDGYQLLVRPSVQEYIKIRMKAREKRTEITQDRVLQELAKIGFADIKDFLRYRTERTIVDTDDEGEPVIGYKQIVEAKASDEIDGTLVNEVSVGRDGTFKFKLHDKMAALEKMGKHLGMFVDRVQAQVVSTNVNTSVQEVLTLPEEEQQKYIDELCRIAKGGT